MSKFNSYDQYKKAILEKLPDAVDKTWKDGVYKYRGEEIERKHILPLENNINTPTNRAAALNDYLEFDCAKCLGKNLKGLHPYSHHLTSSQLLCMMFFSNLINNECCATENLVTFMMEAFGIKIHEGAKCEFEFIQNDVPDYQFDVKDGELQKGIGLYEGTSFDFHIQDGDVEVYFEIKFTENGFKKEKEDKRHKLKAEEYLKVAPPFIKNIVHTPPEFLAQYQIYRNAIRAKDDNKYVIFISDGNNPATNKDKNMMKGLMPANVQFKTWQKIIGVYPYELPFQLKAILEI